MGPAQWDAFKDGAFEPVDDQSEHNAICKAIVDMVEEITRLKHLRVTGVFKDDSAGRKMEKSQALVGGEPGGLW